MTTRITVTTGDGGLLERNAQQQAANRQGTLVKGQAEKAVALGDEQLRKERIAQGRDPLTGFPLSLAGSTSRLTRINQEPAAFRDIGANIAYAHVAVSTFTEIPGFPGSVTWYKWKPTITITTLNGFTKTFDTYEEFIQKRGRPANADDKIFSSFPTVDRDTLTLNYPQQVPQDVRFWDSTKYVNDQVDWDDKTDYYLIPKNKSTCYVVWRIRIKIINKYVRLSRWEDLTWRLWGYTQPAGGWSLVPNVQPTLYERPLEWVSEDGTFFYGYQQYRPGSGPIEFPEYQAIGEWIPIVERDYQAETLYDDEYELNDVRVFEVSKNSVIEIEPPNPLIVKLENLSPVAEVSTEPQTNTNAMGWDKLYTYNFNGMENIGFFEVPSFTRYEEPLTYISIVNAVSITYNTAYALTDYAIKYLGTQRVSDVIAYFVRGLGIALTLANGVYEFDIDAYNTNGESYLVEYLGAGVGPTYYIASCVFPGSCPVDRYKITFYKTTTTASYVTGFVPTSSFNSNSKIVIQRAVPTKWDAVYDWGNPALARSALTTLGFI